MAMHMAMKLVAPQQVAVGVSVGVEIVSQGINEMHDEAERHNTPLVVVAEEGVNWHNEFSRKALVRRGDGGIKSR